LLYLSTERDVYRLLGVSLETRDVPVLQPTAARGHIAVSVSHNALTPTRGHKKEPFFSTRITIIIIVEIHLVVPPYLPPYVVGLPNQTRKKQFVLERTFS